MTICGAGKIIAYMPDGTTERVLAMPCGCSASVTVGGEDLDQVFVTCRAARFLAS